MMHLIIHIFNTSMIPYISLDQYLNPNLYTIPNMQIMRFFCCSVYIDKLLLSMFCLLVTEVWPLIDDRILFLLNIFRNWPFYSMESTEEGL